MPRAKRQRPATTGHAAADGVWCRWDVREFIALEEDAETGDYCTKLEPVPVVGLQRSVMDLLAEETGVPLTDAAHKRIEELVARRILNVCGFTDFGADVNSMFIPVRARPAALEVIKKAGSLLNAIEAFDQTSGGVASGRIDHWIEADCGASPRTVLQSLKDTYRRYVSGRPKAKQLGRAVFMSDVRDQILANLIEDWDFLTGEERNRVLVRFLSKLDEHVLRPLSSKGRIQVPPGGAPALGAMRDAIPIALVNTANSADALRKAVESELIPYDRERAAIAAHWARAFARHDSRGSKPRKRKKLVE